MSVIGSNILAGASGQGGGYNLTKSLRFRSSASAYLSRTPASAGNRRTWTWSAWVKRGAISSASSQNLFSTYSGSSNGFAAIRLEPDNTFYVFDWNGSAFDWVLSPTQVFRDPSAWYHIVVAVDTTQATSSNRVKIYVNGIQVTAFSTTTYPSPNLDTYTNSTQQAAIGSTRTSSSNSEYFDGYLAEVNFVNAQQLTPSSFGETSTSTGVWIPKKYTGTYGTNGFYLPFTDTTSTSTLGTDFSGNSNTWTVNNISLTSGSTYDSMNDVPTLTSATTANYCVLNPLNKVYSTYTLSDGNLNWTSGTVNMGAFGTIQLPTSGKYYWEIVMTASAGGSPQIGVGGGTDVLGNLGAYYRSNGNKEQYGGVSGNGSSAYGATWTTNDVIGVAYDADTSSGQITFYKNNSSQGVAFSSLKTNFPNGLFSAFQNNASGTTTFIANFGQRPFTYTPPTGFVALNTFNLPTPTIGATASTTANKYMDVSLYTGNGSTQSITGVGFQPDWVWIKDRSTVSQHVLTDSVRGVDRQLFSSLTNAEQTSATAITSFNSNGFTTGANPSPTGATNSSPDAFVAWQWRASNATAVTNTAGSITSTVSANTTAGFSIVTYTGTGANATVGHGLGVAPSMIIVKGRFASNWSVYHASITNATTSILILNSTSAVVGSLPTYWNSTAPTSTVFSLGSDSNVNSTNSAGLVAYCFAQVAGYSAFGSYTGNGSTDGAFIFTGFRPRYLMIKSTSVESWELFDTSRSPYNQAVALLEADSSGAENTSSTSAIDILSNGFKQRNTRGATNASGQTYIYMAFAENPFKYANAR